MSSQLYFSFVHVYDPFEGYNHNSSIMIDRVSYESNLYVVGIAQSKKEYALG